MDATFDALAFAGREINAVLSAAELAATLPKPARMRNTGQAVQVYLRVIEDDGRIDMDEAVYMLTMMALRGWADLYPDTLRSIGAFPIFKIDGKVVNPDTDLTNDADRALVAVQRMFAAVFNEDFDFPPTIWKVAQAQGHEDAVTIMAICMYADAVIQMR